ncbi:WecB/TagA/CpsF family glycosyltransferase [Nisaea nitritireducens]|uniref:WecB/TagA/CpsF family glycosyltransferase n=1 Tax=Nisaea nitritireducens TaxID=568392 RepID=UPI001866C9CE|nr:WecB/TagA/CpsF family glycosyltransferase [Nisaea nitritireducens]
MIEDSNDIETVTVLGRRIAAGRFAQIGEAILARARSAKPAYICVSGAHPLSLAKADPDFASALDGAALIVPDGMPVKWTLALKGHRDSERVAGPDLAAWLISRAEGEGLPVYFYGGMPDELDDLRRALAVTHPKLNVVGWESPPLLPHRPEFDAETAKRIDASSARLVFIGLGCPRQEFWMSRHSAAVNGTMVGIGAAFNFLSGRLERAPRAMQSLGLEWLYRLIQEPRRLLGRYLLHNTRFIWFALLDLISHWCKRSKG